MHWFYSKKKYKSNRRKQEEYKYALEDEPVIFPLVFIYLVHVVGGVACFSLFASFWYII